MLINMLGQARSPGCTVPGWCSLQLGVFFLPTSALLAGVSLLISITLAKPDSAWHPLQRPVAKGLLLLSGLMILSLTTAIKPDLAAIGLANWLPFFWFFLAVAPYLSTNTSRRRIGLLLVIGTMPVIVVGLLQTWLGWSTPLRGLGGLLEWTMRFPGRATGIFDTVNATSGWLLITFPFLLQRLRYSHNSPLARNTTLAVIGLATTTMLLTSSRVAVLMLPVVLLLSARKKQLPWILGVIAIYAVLVGVKLTGAIDDWPGLHLLVPDLLSNKLERLINPASSLTLQSPEVRTSIYPLAVQLVQASPWLGIGENGFRSLGLEGALPLPANILSEGLNHSHSLPLEFALSHGLPALLLLLAIVGSICFRAVQCWRLEADPQGENRAWLISAGLVIWLHLWDIPAYDSRFNMVDWLIMAALLGIASGPINQRGEQNQLADEHQVG
jgi:O-antigen ligase